MALTYLRLNLCTHTISPINFSWEVPLYILEPIVTYKSNSNINSQNMNSSKFVSPEFLTEHNQI